MKKMCVISTIWQYIIMLKQRIDTIFLRDAACLAIAALLVSLPSLFLQLVPGYMDAEYYYAGALNLAQGQGFSEPYVWNTLALPDTLPAASHLYWMPLPSVLAALGMMMFSAKSYLSARFIFICLAMLVPVLTYVFAFHVSQQRSISRIAAWMAVFPGVYLVYATLPESFTPYMFFGGLFCLFVWVVIKEHSARRLKTAGIFFIIGLLCGLMHLSRADGILWPGYACILLLFLGFQYKNWKAMIWAFLGLLIGYGLVMAPWYVRNMELFGWIFPPGNTYTLFLTNYNDTFLYPVQQITVQRWLDSGWQMILTTRLKAVGANLLTVWMIQFELILLPFFLLWLKENWRSIFTRWLLLCYFLQFLFMSVFFPYAGMRGGFFHSGSAFQIVFWVGSSIGLYSAIRYLMQRRHHFDERIPGLLAGGAIFILALATGMLYQQKVFGKTTDRNSWQAGYHSYVQLNNALLQNGISEDAGVLINNPPGFFLASGRLAVVVPNAPITDTAELARKYDIGYIILDEHIVPDLEQVYTKNLSTDDVNYLFTTGTYKIYKVR
jgi:hypothetical protein